MIIRYRIYGNWNPIQINILKNFNIHVELGHDSFNIDEGEDYFKLKPYLDGWGCNNLVGTFYDSKEVNEASKVVFEGYWINGYPQPDRKAGYLSLSYSFENYCEKCGSGLTQKAPIRVIKEPKWGSKKLFSLNWIYDEIFVHKDIYEEVFKKYDIKSMPVLLYKKDIVIESTAQLIIPMTEIPLITENQPFEICEICLRKKYSAQIRGFFPAFEEQERKLNIFKSQESFGSGPVSFNKIILTKELRIELLNHKIKANYMPVNEK
jgi:hypothetical protein